MKLILISLAGTAVMMALVMKPDLGYILVGVHVIYQIVRFFKTRRFRRST